MKEKEIYKCSKCGFCLPKCPVYNELFDESISPRAKVQLIKHFAEKDIVATDNLNKIVSKCLMCGNCTANCPSGVRHDSLFMRMRSGMIETLGDHWYVKAAYHLLCHNDQLNLAAKIAKFGHNVVLKNLAQEIKIGNIPVKHLPNFNSVPFRDRIPQKILPSSKLKGKVLYFTGCGTNYVYESVGRAVVYVLEQMGFEIEIPGEQVCCGLPIFFHGNMEKAVPNIQRNIDIFDRNDVEAIVVDCATCGSAMRNEWITVLQELGFDTESAQRLSKKVKDISEFVFDHLDLLKPVLNVNSNDIIVTYHSPCHLRNTQQVQHQIESLLSSLPGVSYCQSIDFDSCCGGGGTFFMDFPGISKKIVKKKIDNARQTGAQLLATGCPGCRLNLSGNMKASQAMKVLHPIELVAMSLNK